MKALVMAGGLPQIELINQLKERGIFTVLADGSAAPLAKPYADKTVQINIFDVEAIKELAVREQVDFLITCCADQVLLIVAQVSELLGLPCYISYKTAQDVSDKRYMKRIFWKHGIPTSRYVEMEDLDWEKIRELRYPMVVKPTDAYSSRGVRRANDDASLQKYFEEAKRISRTGTAIVEEFCEGEEISVDVYVENGEAHILCVSNSEKIKDDDRFVIFRGKYPANTSPAVMEQIRQVAQQIADAFELKDAPMLIQMINSGTSVSVLEFCARTGGNMKYLLIRRVCGFDVIKAVIDLTLGLKPHVETGAPENRYIANDFIYCREGVFERLQGFEEMKEAGYITDYQQIRPRGFVVHGVTSSSDRVAGFTVQADTVDEFNRKHAYAVENVAILNTEGEDMMRHDLLPGIRG